MEVEGFAKLFSEADVPAERLDLPVAVGRGVEEVEARLADTDHLVRRLRQRLQAAVVVVGERRLEVHGVHADAGVHRVEAAGKLDGAAGRLDRRADADDHGDAGGLGAGDHRVEFVVREEVEVGVGVGQHRRGVF